MTAVFPFELQSILDFRVMQASPCVDGWLNMIVVMDGEVERSFTVVGVAQVLDQDLHVASPNEWVLVQLVRDPVGTRRAPLETGARGRVRRFAGIDDSQLQ